MAKATSRCLHNIPAAILVLQFVRNSESYVGRAVSCWKAKLEGIGDDSEPAIIEGYDEIERVPGLMKFPEFID